MDYNIFYIPQITISGSTTPELPYYVTIGDKDSKPLYYGLTEEDCQNYISNL